MKEDKWLLRISGTFGFLLGTFIIGIIWIIFEVSSYSVAPRQTYDKLLYFPNGAIFVQVRAPQDLKGE